MNSFANRCLLATLVIAIACAVLPSAALAQENVIKVTICDSADLPGCQDKMRNNKPYRMVFDPEVLTIECDNQDGACTNDSSRVVWEITNKQDGQEADIKYTGSSGANRRIFTEQRIGPDKKRSVSEKPRNLKFDDNKEARWRYEIIVRDADGKIYARKDPEIIIRGSR
jgi:hypothetical protein